MGDAFLNQNVKQEQEPGTGTGQEETIVTNGLLANYDASDLTSYPGTGATWFDTSGNNRHISLVGSPSYDNTFGGRFLFTGSQRVSDISVPTTGRLTVEFVINYTAINNYHNLFDNNGARPMLWIDSSNKFEISFPNASGGLNSALSYSGQNIVFTTTYDSTSIVGIQLYINGVFIAQRIAQHVSWSNSATFQFFNRSGSSNFRGSVYGFRFYNRILTQGEITKNFNVTKTRIGL